MLPILAEIRFAALMSLSGLLWFLLSTKVDRIAVYSSKQFRCILAIFLAATLSIPFSYYKSGSFEAWQELIVPLSIYLVIVSSIRSLASLMALLWLLVLCMDYHAFWITRDFFTGNYTGTRVEGHVGGVFRGSNELAEFFIMTIPLCWVVYRNAKSKIARLLGLGSIALLLCGLLSTQSRGGLLGLASLSITSILLSKNKLSGLLGLSILIGCLVCFLPAKFFERYSTLTVHRENIDPSAGSRLFAWKKGLEMFIDHPLTGVGIGQFGVAFGTEYRDRGKEWEEVYAPYLGYNAWLRPHNTFVQILAEVGVLGLLALIMLLVTSFRCLWRFSSSGDGAQKLLSNCLLISTTGYFTCLMFDHQAFTIPTFTLFALLTLPQFLFTSQVKVKRSTVQSG